jgi:hypothetical protein
MDLRSFLLLIVFGFGATISLAADPQRMVAHLIGEVSSSALIESGKASEIRAFDIAPDGRSIGVIYETWNMSPPHLGVELWIARWDRSSQEIAWKTKLATDTHRGYAGIHDRKDVIFTNDQSRLVVIGLGSIWSVDPQSGAIFGPIDPQDVALGAPVDVIASKGSIVEVTYDIIEKDGFYSQIIDLSSGKKIVGWPIATVPQSFSPDGRRSVAVAPGERNKGGVAGLQVVDAATGAKLKSVTVGFGFKKRYPNETGGVLAQFLDNDRLIISPDHMTDHTGNHSGYSLEIIDIAQNRIVGEIKPQYFVPAGEFRHFRRPDSLCSLQYLCHPVRVSD